MGLLIDAWTMGLILSLLGFGVFISSRIFRIADITVDGSVVLGAAVSAKLLVGHEHPLVSLAAAFAAGMAAGAVTGTLHTVFKIDSLLSGILVMTALFSINLRIMGTSNIPLSNSQTVGKWFVESMAALDVPKTLVFLGWDIATRDLVVLASMAGISAAVALVLFLFFRTNLGICMRAVGDNPQMMRALGTNVSAVTVLGLALANGLVALSGALTAQCTGNADIQMGIGTIVWGLASVILGEALVGSKQVGYSIVGTVMGSILFRLLVAMALLARLQPSDLKLITAVFLFVALVLPRLLGLKTVALVRSA